MRGDVAAAAAATIGAVFTSVAKLTAPTADVMGCMLDQRQTKYQKWAFLVNQLTYGRELKPIRRVLVEVILHQRQKENGNTAYCLYKTLRFRLDLHEIDLIHPRAGYWTLSHRQVTIRGWTQRSAHLDLTEFKLQSNTEKALSPAKEIEKTKNDTRAARFVTDMHP